MDVEDFAFDLAFEPAPDRVLDLTSEAPPGMELDPPPPGAPLGKELRGDRKGPRFARQLYSQQQEIAPDRRQGPARRRPPTAWAPFGEVPALPGVDVPPPPPFGRPPVERHVVTVDESDDSRGEGEDAAQGVPRSRRGRHPTPRRARQREVIVIDEDGPAGTSPHKRRLGRSDDGPAGPSPPKRRLGRSVYDAVQTHGHFGMVDTGESDGSVRRLLVHVPKRSRGYILDIRPGEVIHANSGRGKPIGGKLEVKYVTRHQYFAPGRSVTSCVIGVPEWQWQKFM